MRKIFIAIALLFSLTITSANAVEVTQEAKITGLYVAFFNRAADQEGLTYWTTTADNVAKQGGDVSSVFKTLSKGFATHPTFTSTYAHLNNQEFVAAIYRNALGRDGDAEGIAYWTDLLDRVMIRSDMVATFVELSLVTDLTKENYPNLSDGDLAAAQLRQDLITNKVNASLAFTHQLGVLSNVVDSQNPEADPAYLASIQIISKVTEDEETVLDVIAFLDSIINTDDPIALINEAEHISVDTNTAPVAYTGADRNVEVGQSITITGSGSDADGTVVSYEWKEGSTVLANTASFSYIPTTEGMHTLTFTVMDDDGATASATMDISVDTNTAPVAYTGADRNVEVGQSITITGSGSDADGTVVSYEWKEGSTVLANTASFSYIPTTEGMHTLTFTVMDDDGATASATMDINAIFVPPLIHPLIHLYGGINYEDYLGCINCDQFDLNSICNEFGVYGSRFSSTSIWNSFSTYGNKFSAYSPWNMFSVTAPVIVDNSLNFYGHFSINTFHPNRTNIEFFVFFLDNFSEFNDLEAARNWFCE